MLMGSIPHLSMSHAAAAGDEAIFGVFANFYRIEISYLLGPISPHDLEISYLPAGAQFLSLHLVLYASTYAPAVYVYGMCMSRGAHRIHIGS